MVMNAAVAVAVHDHVHLAGAGHAVVGVGAVDAAIGQVPQCASRFNALVESRSGFRHTACAAVLPVSSRRSFSVASILAYTPGTGGPHRPRFAAGRSRRNESGNRRNRWRDRKSMSPSFGRPSGP